MARQFKPVRFFVMMGEAAFVVSAGCHEPATFTRSKTLSLDSLLDPFRSHRSHRVSAGGICGGVRLNR